MPLALSIRAEIDNEGLQSNSNQVSLNTDSESVPCFAVGLDGIPNALEGIKVIPNLVSDIAKIELDLKEAAQIQISLYDMSGKVVKHEPITKLSVGVHNFRIDVSDFSNGHYILVVESATQRFSKQLIVSH